MDEETSNSGERRTNLKLMAPRYGYVGRVELSGLPSNMVTVASKNTGEGSY